MTETYSITTEKGITLHVGETTISGVPSLELAESFLEIAKRRWPDGDGILNDNNKVSLIGSLHIDSLIQELSE